MRRKYTDDQMKKAILRWVEVNKIPPTSQNVMRRGIKPSHTTFRTYYGDWHSAMKKLGIKIPRKYYREELPSEYKRPKALEKIFREEKRYYDIPVFDVWKEVSK